MTEEQKTAMKKLVADTLPGIEKKVEKLTPQEQQYFWNGLKFASTNRAVRAYRNISKTPSQVAA